MKLLLLLRAVNIKILICVKSILMHYLDMLFLGSFCRSNRALPCDRCDCRDVYLKEFQLLVSNVSGT